MKRYTKPYPFLFPRARQNGVALLLVIVIIASVALVLGLNASLLGVSDLDTSFSGGRGNAALFLADGCMEDALRHLRLENMYGVGSPPMQYNVDGGSCTVEIIASGSSRTVTVSANTDDGYYKTIRARIVVTGNDPLNSITINSWFERSDGL